MFALWYLSCNLHIASKISSLFSHPCSEQVGIDDDSFLLIQQAASIVPTVRSALFCCANLFQLNHPFHRYLVYAPWSQKVMQLYLHTVPCHSTWCLNKRHNFGPSLSQNTSPATLYVTSPHLGQILDTFSQHTNGMSNGSGYY